MKDALTELEDRVYALENICEVLLAFNPILMSELRNYNKADWKKLKSKVRVRAIKSGIEIHMQEDGAVTDGED